MPVKFECPRCEKRFVDWGAERMGYKCPQCEEELVRVGTATEVKPVRRPTLKRKPKVERVKVPDDTEFDLIESDDGGAADEELVVDETEEVLVDEEEDLTEEVELEEAVAEDEDEEVEEDEDMPQVLDFEDATLDSGIDMEDKL